MTDSGQAQAELGGRPRPHRGARDRRRVVPGRVIVRRERPHPGAQLGRLRSRQFVINVVWVEARPDGRRSDHLGPDHLLHVAARNTRRQRRLFVRIDQGLALARTRGRIRPIPRPSAADHRTATAHEPNHDRDTAHPGAAGPLTLVDPPEDRQLLPIKRSTVTEVRATEGGGERCAVLPPQAQCGSRAPDETHGRDRRPRQVCPAQQPSCVRSPGPYPPQGAAPLDVETSHQVEPAGRAARRRRADPRTPTAPAARTRDARGRPGGER